MTEPRQILLIQLRRIGDVLMTTPSIRALRRAHPGARIAFLTEPPSDQVLRHNPALDEVLCLPRGLGFWRTLAFLWRLRRRRFDVVVDFFGNPRSAQIAWITGARRRVGFDFRGRGRLYTDRVPFRREGLYAAEHKTQLLAPLGVAPAGLELEFHPSPEDRDFARGLLADMGVAPGDLLVTLSPVSRQPYKVWPAERFAAVADDLIGRRGAKVLFIYGPGEEGFVDAVRAAMAREALPGYPPPTLGQTRALFERAALHVGNDNGPRHFAIAAGIPTVAVFGRPKAANWTPPGSAIHLAAEFDPGCKDRCAYPACAHLDCLNKVAVADVLERVEALLGPAAPAAGGAA